MNITLASNDTQLEIKSYTLNLGFRTEAINDSRDIVPYHEIGLTSVPDGAGQQTQITIGFWTDLQHFAPTELGFYYVAEKKIAIKAPISEFERACNILRGQTPVFFIFNQANVVGGNPDMKSITTSSIVTGNESS